MISVGILKRAIEECEKSDYKFRVGAVVFKGDRIISSGHNGVRSSSIHNKYKNHINSLHAEQAAVMGVNWKVLNGYSILVIKISKKNKFLSNAKPCNMCRKLLTTIGIRKIYYSDDKGQIVLYKDTEI